MGLPITKEIIELHSGKIWVESPPENLKKGTAFKILLPVNQLEQNHFDIENIQDAIDAHLEWSKMVDKVCQTGEMPFEIPNSMIVNDNLCSLGQWINQGELPSKNISELKKAHKEFHFLAGECIAYFQLGNTTQASTKLGDFHQASNKVIMLLKELKAQTS